MSEQERPLERILGLDGRAAMATLVATRGTTPKKEGAKMWVGARGRLLGSVTIGGCVDARVIEESERVLDSDRPVFLSMHLGEEEAWDLGLTCAGDVDVLVEPVASAAGDPTTAWYRRIDEVVAGGRAAALVTVLTGGFERALVLEDGSVEGTLGAPELDDEARRRAEPLLRRGASRTARLGADGPEAFFEVHAPPPTLLVFGATEVAIHLVALAGEIGLRTVVVDGRPRFASAERFPGASEILVGMPSEVAGTLPYTSRTYVTLLAHDYKYDLPVLKAVEGTPVAYVGLLGSRRRGAALKDFLRADGVSEAFLERVRVPAGLDIGAEDAPGIALSILAEALAEGAGRSGGPLRTRVPTSGAGG